MIGDTPEGEYDHDLPCVAAPKYDANDVCRHCGAGPEDECKWEQS